MAMLVIGRTVLIEINTSKRRANGCRPAPPPVFAGRRGRSPLPLRRLHPDGAGESFGLLD
jgi:hypothetical protein